MTRYFVCGGLGFIGHHVVKRLLKEQPDCEIVIYDNLSSGKLEFLEDVKDDARLRIIIGDIKNLPKLVITNKIKEPEPMYYSKGALTFGRAIHWCEGLKGTPQEKATIRAKTFPGIAEAMKQWVEYIGIK